MDVSDIHLLITKRMSWQKLGSHDRWVRFQELYQAFIERLAAKISGVLTLTVASVPFSESAVSLVIARGVAGNGGQ